MKILKKAAIPMIAALIASTGFSAPVFAAENLCDGLKASVTFFDKNGESLSTSMTTVGKMTDGNDLSAFTSPIGVDKGSYLFDLYKVNWLNRVYMQEMYNTIQGYEIYVSADKKKWEKVYTGTKIGAYGKIINFKPTKTRYLRLDITKTDNDFNDATISLVEIQAYADSSVVKDDLKTSIYLAKQKYELFKAETMKHHYTKEQDDKFKNTLDRAQKIYENSLNQDEIDKARDDLDTLVNDWEINLVPTAEDYQVVSDRIVEMLVGNTLPYDDARKATIEALEKEIEGYIDTMIPNPVVEIWEEFIPPDPNPATEPKKIHDTIAKFRKMAIAYCQEHNKYYQDEEILQIILDGIDWVLKNKFYKGVKTYGNWWYWTVSAPTVLSETALMLGDKMPMEMKLKIEEGTADQLVDDFHYTITGTNRFYFATIRLKHACMLQTDLDMHKLAYSIAQETLYADTVPTGIPTDGYYWDGSFVYHTGFFYNGSYGRDLISNIGMYIEFLAGTPWQVEQYVIDNITGRLEKGFESVLYRGRTVEISVGRAVGDGGSMGADIAGSIGLLGRYVTEPMKSKLLGTYKEALIKNHRELDATVESDEIVPRGDIRWLKTFPVGTKAVLHTPEYGVGLGMFSKRTRAFEAPNGDAMKNWYVSSGTMFTMTKDDEQYNRDYFIAADHYRYPGITVDRVARSLTRFEGEIAGNYDIAGSVTMDAKTGLSAMELTNWNSSLYAQKSWFMFDDEIVALGSGISGGSTTIETVIDQRKLKDDNSNIITVNGVVDSEEYYEDKPINATTIHLSGNVDEGADMGYFFPEGTDIKVKRSLNTEKEADMWLSASTNVVSKNFYTMIFDHGVSPKKDKYAYVVLPNVSSEELTAYSGNPDIEILAHDDIVHAVRDNTTGETGYMFWSTSGGTADNITANTRLMMMKRENDYQTEFSVSDPTVVYGGTAKVKTDYNVAEVIECDDAITVTSLSPLEFTVKLAGLEGREVKLAVAKSKLGYDKTAAKDVIYAKAGETKVIYNNLVKDLKSAPVMNGTVLMYPLADIADLKGSVFNTANGISQVISDDYAVKIYEDGTFKVNGEDTGIKGGIATYIDGVLYVNAKVLNTIYGGKTAENGDSAVIGLDASVNEAKKASLFLNMENYLKRGTANE